MNLFGHRFTPMSTDDKEFLYKDLSYKIIGLAMEVHNKLGPGFLEKVYENALMLLFRREGIGARQQAPIKVYFDGEVVGEYFTDILVEDKIILEIKALDKIIDAHIAQTLNYLKATDLRIAIILNFGKRKLEYERLII
jgi:GxxExxY protein